MDRAALADFLTNRRGSLQPKDVGLTIGQRRRVPGCAAKVASLRAAYGFMGPHSRAGEIVRKLTDRSEEFADLWKLQEVWRRFAEHKVLVHPEVGELKLDCQALFSEDQSQALIVLTAAPHSAAEERLKLLAVVGGQEFINGR